ncbi:PREDICTED: putative transporter SVOPL isoform X3 [Chinchilla lanigera]|uniref:putative transporter SVOPL isoform X3 n=1 Tax=Chinchilla lanigera TaxID=34839 RepID=UPI0006979173|nr:PREDICTED: putative transporter SVOPL isoform X3 [Chinchilla lanigera]XP_013360425.1 PREDICTED: putative transporter SVOPL isoform X3 [Chinchilla lanigera]
MNQCEGHRGRMASRPTEPVTILSLRMLSHSGPEPPPQKAAPPCPPSSEPKTFTVEDAVETIGFGRFHIALFLIMGSTGVVEAMEIMLIAVVSPVIRCEWHLENWQVAFVTTMVFFGYMVSSILFGLLADRYGRWKILLLSFLWGAYFSLLTSFAPSYVWFVFLRTMVGCGVSGHAQGLIIKTEFLPTKYRGYMLPLSQVFWLAGSLLIIGLASVVIPTTGWRWLIRIASIPGIILILAFKFIPESARFNVSTGNTQAALRTLQRIASMNRAVLPEGQLLEPVLEKRGRFADLLDAKYLRTTLQIWVIWLGISFAYYGVILASAELLERDLVCGAKSESQDVHSVDSEGIQSPCYCHLFAPSDYRTMIISTLGEIALNPLNILGINFLGRRLSLSITMGCTALFFLLLNICTSSAGLIGFLFMLRALVAANFNTIYIYTAEVYPTTMRALGMGTSGSLCRIGAMVAPFISQVLMSASFLGALCLFSSVCVVCAVSAFTLPIETKGRALQQNVKIQ